MQTSQPVNTVLIDDSDPSIQYGPGWVNKPSLLDQTDPKYPMYGTLHETVNQTDLTYSFSGSSIVACAQVAGNFSQVNVYSLWNCSIDRVKVGYIVDLGPPTAVCCGDAAVDLNTQVQHEIRISAIGSQNRPISFDYLAYETSLTVPVADLLIYSDDLKSLNIEGWDFERGITTEPTVNFTFDFYGSSILWFSFYNPTFVGLDESEVTYSVDGSTVSFYSTLDLSPPAAKQALNGSRAVDFLFFQTFSLPRGQHRLEVNYTSNGSGKAVPLTLTQLLVQNSTTNPNSSVPTTTPTPTPAGTNGARRVHLAIILGCCGAAILALLILGIFFARRRMRRRDRASPESGTSSLIEPFNHDPASAPVGPHQKGQRPSEVQEQDVVETAEVQVEAPPSYVTGPHDS